MKGVTFRALYVPLILDGTKTTTIRKPSNRLPYPGERFRLVCRYDRPPFATATALHMREVTADQLTEADARADGFPTLTELLDALAQYRTDGADGPDALPDMPPLPWRIIHFQLDPTP